MSERDDDEPVSLEKSDPPLDFDPYRFGRPEHPVDPRYAPPGYVAPEPAPPAAPDYPYGQQPDARPQPPWGAPGPYPPAGQYPASQYPPAGQYPYGQYVPGSPVPPGQYGPGPYGPPGWGYPQPKSGNGKAAAALVCGIASVVLCWLTIFDVVPVVLAISLGAVALRGARRSPRPEGRGMAITGIACAVVGAILAVALTTWALRLSDDCGGLDSASDSQLRTCIQQHI